MKKIITTILLVQCWCFLVAQAEININDGENNIHLTIYGKGRPILIINGGPGMNSNGFRSLARRMGETNKAIIYDQRGTGQSHLAKVDADNLTLDLMINDIEIIRKHLGIEDWVILGHSFGGMLASYYASKFPNRIKGLILSSSGGIDMQLFSRINITSRLSDPQKDSLDYWNHKISQGDTSYFARLQRGRFLAPAYLYDQSNLLTVAKRLTEGNSTVNRLVYQNMRKINFDCSKGLKKLKAPVLIIQGREDIIDRQTAIRAMDVLQNDKLVILERCNHYGWLDSPKQYFESIDSFLLDIQRNIQE